MAEGEDSGIVSSPSDTQPTSPDGSLSVDGRPDDRRDTLLEPQKDTSSDSDEGCAAWRQKLRHDTSPQEQSVDCFEDGSQLTVQLHQTLADLEADLAGHTNIAALKDTSFTKSTDSNDVPVSLVDMYVPVTAIDELLEDYEFNIVEHEVKSVAKTASAGSKEAGFSQQSDVEPQNKNNNAYTAAVGYRRSSKNTKKSEQSNKPQENQLTGVKKEEKTQKTKTKVTSVPDINIVKEDKETLAVKSNADIQKNFKTTEINPELVKSTPQTLQQQKPNLYSVIQRSLPAEINKEIQRASQTSSSFNSPHGKITHNVTSRFGMKTFTVVPPKPSTMHPTQSAVTVSNGAIRIDDQGNMVTAGVAHNKVSRLSESENSEGVPLREKAKAFWCSNERQENATQRKGLIDKTKDMNGLSCAPPTVGLEAKLRTMHSAASEPVKTVQSKEETKDPIKDATVANTKRIEVESKSSASNSVQMPSKPVLPPPLPSDLKKQLNFLKPSRRTSSQYVASAIAKYTSDKPTSISKVPDSSKSVKTQTAAGFQRSGPAIQVTPLPSSQSSLSNNNNSSAHIISGPKRPMSPLEYVSDSRRDFEKVKLDKEGFQKSAVSKESSDVLNTETAKSNHSPHNGAIQKCATANNNKDYIKHVQPRSSSPPKNSALHPSSKPPIAPKSTSQDHINGTKDTNKDVNLQSSASDSNVVPVPVTVFGPVQKFKPVICRSIEKETSLHSSLMEAIQTGGGRDRLKKISTSPCNQRKVTYIEEENERSALLAAIRAQNNNRLKKTKSEAASELEQFRKVTSDEERNEGSSPSPPSLTCSSPGFTSPPSPPMFRPPPPPPILPQGKPNSVVQINTNTPINPALAREAMLEAIRSGAGAEKLKKVSVPSKTIHVNGRLGTIQATVPQH